jgi:hypothetical protein
MQIMPFFSISPKLKTVSGESDAVKPDTIMNILNFFPGQLKFVANDSEECSKELVDVVKNLRYNGLMDEVWVMPLGATKEEQLQIAPIVEKYQQMGFKIALRCHTYVWSDAKNR